MSLYTTTPKYVPGEPYEFPDHIWVNREPGLMRYRCFRGECPGSAVLVNDRNSHNNYHNKRGE